MWEMLMSSQKQRKKTQEWRKDRQRKGRGENILKKARGDDEVQGTVGGTNSRLEDNPLSLPRGLQRKEAGQRKVCAVQGRGGLLGENGFDNLLASRPSLPAKLSQSLFNGKASPKGSRCGWNQFKCEGAGASSGSLPHFFSSFFFSSSCRCPVAPQLGSCTQVCSLGTILKTVLIKDIGHCSCLSSKRLFLTKY